MSSEVSLNQQVGHGCSKNADPIMPTVAIDRRRAIVIIAVLVVGALPAGFQDLTIDRTYHQGDHGYALQAGARILSGEVPYRDFLFIWPPLSPLLTALCFRIFGISMVTAKMAWAVGFACAIPLGYRWLREIVPRGPALAGTFAVWASLPIAVRISYPLNLCLPVALLAFQQIERFARTGRVSPALWAGTACGLCVGLKHNVGILLGIALMVRIFAAGPLTALYPARSGGRGIVALVRWGVVIIALSALLALDARFVTPLRCPLVVLPPAALLIVAAAVRAGRLDGSASSGVAWPRAVSISLVMAAGCAAVVAPWVVWLLRERAFESFLGCGLIDARAGAASWLAEYGLRLSLRPLDLPVVLLGTGLILALGSLLVPWARVRSSAAVAAIVLVVVIVLKLRFRVWEGGLEYGAAALSAFVFIARGYRALAAATCCALFAVLCFPAPTINHGAIGLAPAMALGLALVWRAPWLPRLAATAVVAVPLLTGWTEWGEVLAGKLARTPGLRGGTWTGQATAAGFAAVLSAVERLDPGGDQLIGWPAQGELVFLSGRSNPTLMDSYWPGFLDDRLESTLIEQVKRSSVRVVIINRSEDPSYGHEVFRYGTPRLHAYLDSELRIAEAIGPWLIYTRRSPPVEEPRKEKTPPVAVQRRPRNEPRSGMR
jgi:hypothetical protein